MPEPKDQDRLYTFYNRSLTKEAPGVPSSFFSRSMFKIPETVNYPTSEIIRSKLYPCSTDAVLKNLSLFKAISATNRIMVNTINRGQRGFFVPAPDPSER